MMLDGKAGGFYNIWRTDETDFQGTYAADGTTWNGKPGTTNSTTPWHPHTDGFNILWYDGHVKWARNTYKVTPNAPGGGPYYWYVTKPANP